MKKILYYDTWEKGYRNFLRLDPFFKNEGFETMLLHTSSLLEDNVEIEKEVEGLYFRDISYYRTRRLKKIIKKENPEAIIMLNLSFIIDRAIVSICKDLGIKVYYLSHGMLIPTNSRNVLKNNLKNSFKKNLLSKFNRKNRYCLFNYLIELKSVSKIISFFFKALKNHTNYTLFPEYSSELDVDKSFVFYHSDYDIMVNDYGFPEDKVEVIGNPELDFFYHSKIKNKSDFLRKELSIKEDSYIAYFDDGLSNVHNWNTNKWLFFLKDLNDSIKKKKCILIIKLHPRRDITGCISFFKENNIKYLSDVDFKNFIHHSEFTISHFSSVIVYALLLNKKVKSPRWGSSKGLEEKFPKELVEYIYDKENFEERFFYKDVNEILTKKYLLESIGEVDGKSTEKVVNKILSDVRNKYVK